MKRSFATLAAALAAGVAAGLLLGLAGCADPDARGAAMEALARWEDRRLADPDSLAEMIAGPDAHVRRAALRTAGLIGRTDALPAVIAALDDPSDAVKAEAALALGFIGDDAGAAPLLDALAAGHARVRKAVLFALARVGNDGEALRDIALHGPADEAAPAWDALRDRAADLDSTLLAETIRAGLVREEADVLWRVLRCAERSGSREIVPEIAAFTNHRHAAVRAHACRALARLADGADDDVEAAALDAVLAALDDLGRMSRRDADRVRVQALRALTATAGPRLDDVDADHVPLVTALTEGARSPNPHVARTALTTMAALAGDRPLPPEAAARESLLPVWRIRLLQAARGYLWRLDDGAGPPPEQVEPVIRAAATSAVCALRGAGLRQERDWHLVMRDPAPQVKEAATAGVAAHVVDLEEMTAWAATLTAGVPGRALLAATAALPAARARFEAEGLPDSSLAAFDDLIQERLRDVLADGPWAAASQAAGLLGTYPSGTTLTALLAAWDAAEGWTGDDVRLGVLGALADVLPADDPETVSAWAPADSLAPSIRRVLEEGFDAADVRQRLRARAVAEASGFVPATAIPGEASLRATVPAVVRAPAQGPVTTPFDAPDVICRTDRGDFTLRLDGRRAPNTCALFLKLIGEGFYDGLTFHRVVPDFVIQGGDPDGTGWGGPGHSIRSEWSDAPYERGAVGIAHSGKDTGGCQWFVCHSDQPHLNGRYTVFAKVVDGMEIVDLVQPDDTFRLEIVAE